LSKFIESHIEESGNQIEDAYAFGRIDSMCEQWMTTRSAASMVTLTDLFFKESQ
jgi:hypothetical protein